jgi:hypothetical protein
MAINKNHEFEDLDGVKCAIVEKQVSEERAKFLEQLLLFNGYTVIVQPVAAKPPPAAPAGGDAAVPQAAPAEPVVQLFTVGVTDVTFNPTNAIFGRLLRTPGGQVVTLAYWKGKETEAQDQVPYFENRF